MTPAERDEVLARVQAINDGRPRIRLGAYNLEQRALSRYVPPGDAAAPLPWRVQHDGCGMIAITFDELVVAMEPDVARRVAHALHAAADAAEENDR